LCLRTTVKCGEDAPQSLINELNSDVNVPCANECSFAGNEVGCEVTEKSGKIKQIFLGSCGKNEYKWRRGTVGYNMKEVMYEGE
jgi:hypothetical protein